MDAWNFQKHRRGGVVNARQVISRHTTNFSDYVQSPFHAIGDEVKIPSKH